MLGRWAGGQVDRWAGGQVDRWAGGQVDRWTGGQVDRWAGGQVDRWTGGQVGRWTGGQVDRWDSYLTGFSLLVALGTLPAVWNLIVDDSFSFTHLRHKMEAQQSSVTSKTTVTQHFLLLQNKSIGQ